MSYIDDLLQRYNEMDEIDRKNFWIGVIGVVLVIILLLTLSDTFNSIGKTFGGGSKYVNESVSGLKTIKDIK